MLKTVLMAMAEAIPAATRARIFTYLTRMAEGVRFASWSAVWDWVKSDPLKISLVAEAIYRAGAASVDLIEAMRNDEYGSKILENLEKRSKQEIALYSKAHGHAESVAMGLGDDPNGEIANALQRQRMGRVLLRVFGDFDTAIAVRDAFLTLKDADYAFLRRVGVGNTTLFVDADSDNDSFLMSGR